MRFLSAVGELNAQAIADQLAYDHSVRVLQATQEHSMNQEDCRMIVCDMDVWYLDDGVALWLALDGLHEDVGDKRGVALLLELRHGDRVHIHVDASGIERQLPGPRHPAHTGQLSPASRPTG